MLPRTLPLHSLSLYKGTHISITGPVVFELTPASISLILYGNTVKYRPGGTIIDLAIDWGRGEVLKSYEPDPRLPPTQSTLLALGRHTMPKGAGQFSEHIGLADTRSAGSVPLSLKQGKFQELVPPPS